MAKSPNYLLGYGERLAESVQVKKGGGKKIPPYSFGESRDRLSHMLVDTVRIIDDIPAAACPNDQAVATLTLHPEYLAKSHYPGGFLRESGLRPVGSRARKITPSKRSRNRESEELITTQFFVAGKRSSFDELAISLPNWEEGDAPSSDLTAIEEISTLTPQERIKPFHDNDDLIPLEVVLHASEAPRDRFILNGFRQYTEGLGIHPDFEHLFFAGGLCFMRMYAAPEQTEEIAQFSFLRVIREMPKLRTVVPILRGIHHRPQAAELPDVQAIDPNLRVAIFDGGIPDDSPLLPWVNAYDAPGVGAPLDDFLWHGETVTSALLFGSANPSTIERPVCHADHYRVIDADTGTHSYELYDVLERVKAILETHNYEFMSLSIGPSLPVDDEEVNAWTSVLDEQLSDGSCLATLAAGNTGHEPEDPVLEPWRIQVPSDCVNGLTVGASDRQGNDWARAPYSSLGPGRSPGIVKPDIVTFGGSDDEPFWVFDPDTENRVVPIAGTSYAAPAALRSAASVRAHFGSVLSPLAIKALLVHRTDANGHERDQVGWGRLPNSVDDLIICPDTCVRVVYQDEITASKYRRVRIPIPDGLQGMVKVTATFCFATEVEPEHPGNYTRSGLDITFRPNEEKFADDAAHPKSASFFQPANLYPVEQELRSDAHKWETCLHASKNKRANGLVRPVFDIHYNARAEGRADETLRKIRYALVVSVEAPKVKDLYDQVVRAYSGRLEALTPVIAVPIRT